MNGSSVIFSLARRCRCGDNLILAQFFLLCLAGCTGIFPVPRCMCWETNAINCEMQLSPGNQFDETNSFIDPCYNSRQKKAIVHRSAS